MSNVLRLSENVQLYEAEGHAAERYACIAFGGIAKGLGVPVFEFMRTLSGAGISSMFVKDPAQGWYQGPIPDLGETTADMAATLTALVRRTFPDKRIVAIGNSMGGFAAILFSCLCGFDRTVVFSPQTFISTELRAQHGDARWQLHMDRIPRRHVEDLKPLILRHRVTVQVYVGGRNALDTIHARHVQGLRGVSVELLPECDHDVSAWLREQGRLADIILAAGRASTRKRFRWF